MHTDRGAVVKFAVFQMFSFQRDELGEGEIASRIPCPSRRRGEYTTGRGRDGGEFSDLPEEDQIFRFPYSEARNISFRFIEEFVYQKQQLGRITNSLSTRIKLLWLARLTSRRARALVFLNLFVRRELLIRFSKPPLPPPPILPAIYKVYELSSKHYARTLLRAAVQHSLVPTPITDLLSVLRCRPACLY